MDNSIYEELKNLASSDKKISKSSTVWTPTNKWYFSSIGMIILPIFFMYLGKKYQSPTTIEIGYLIMALGYIMMMLTPFLALYFHRHSAMSFIKNPLAVIIDNAASAQTLDNGYYASFLNRDILELKLTKLELEAEKNSFIKRTSLVVGAIDKIGLVPGFLALIISFPKIQETGFDWLVFVAYAIPFLHLLGVYAQFLSTRLERYISLIELAIEVKEEKETNST